MLQKYYQLAKPGIIKGNLLNAAGGFLLASSHHLDIVLGIFTLAGTALVIASGCVYNNVLDRNIDHKMKRTAKRALVTGTIRVRAALIYATVLGILGFALLAIFTNLLTVVLGVVALFSYVIVYGYFKRRSPIGTLVGTLPGALPPVAAYTAVTGQLDTGAWLIFIILATWQMAHFYSIALYRQSDYKNAGLPVMPVVHGTARTKLYIMLYILVFIAACSLLTIHDYTGYIFLAVMTILGLTWFALGIRTYTKLDAAKWGRGMFFFSLTVILGLAVMFAVGGRLA